LLDNLLDQGNLAESLELTAGLAALGARYPGVWTLALNLAEVRVANLQPPASAMRLATRCPVCGNDASLIVVSSQLLLALQRLTLLFGKIIEAWAVVEGRLSVTYRIPLEAECDAFRATIAAFVQGDPGSEREPSGSEAGWASVRDGPREPLRRSADLAQLWFVAHEVGHIIDTGREDPIDPNVQWIRSLVEGNLDHLNLGERTHRLWSEEVIADLIATDFLFGSLMRLARPGPDPQITRLAVAADVLGAVAAACETIYQLELAIIGTRADATQVTPNHPPVALRWDMMKGFLGELSGAHSPDEISYLGFVLGQASKRFEKSVYKAAIGFRENDDDRPDWKPNLTPLRPSGL
jgi:ribosomal protein S14